MRPSLHLFLLQPFEGLVGLASGFPGAARVLERDSVGRLWSALLLGLLRLGCVGFGGFVDVTGVGVDWVYHNKKKIGAGLRSFRAFGGVGDLW
jgi:hypothetical protein